MGTTILEYCLANLKTTLDGITAANGYNNTIQSVQRFDIRKGKISFDKVPTIVMTCDDESKDPDPNPLFTNRQRVYLDVFSRHAPDDALTTDERIRSLKADVEKAVMVDIYRGGYAERTMVLGSEPFVLVEGANQFGISIELEILYQHHITNPESKG